jgi:hypothetical protein
MIVITREATKPFLRTDKGSLARKANLEAFDAEIKACYERADMLKATPFPLPDTDDSRALLDSLRSLVQTISGHNDFEDDVDFFEAGMDSLQASRLRRSILNGLRVTPNLPKPVEDLEPEFCFENSSVEKLHRAVAQIMSGTRGGAAGETKESRRIAAMEAMLEKYRQELVDLSYLASQARIARNRKASQPTASEQGSVVLLTGSTGSLGCFLLARLANDPTVSKVICLNRPQSASVDTLKRQMDLMRKRGASITGDGWKKVILYGAELSRVDFGLDDDDFDEVCEHFYLVVRPQLIFDVRIDSSLE